MKVWFGTTTSELIKYYDYYFAIRKYLIDSGNEIMYDWLDSAYKAIKRDPSDRKRDVKKIYNEVIYAIDNSDVSVIEYTVPNFSSSHQITYSIHKKKPTLVMRLQTDNKNFKESYIDAIESDYLIVQNYNINTYKSVIDNFLEDSAPDHKLKRYNIVLSHKQNHYLDWASNFYKKSRSEIIRDSINKEIIIDDQYKG